MDIIMNSSKQGGELVNFKIDGIEKIHQGENVKDENNKVYWKRHAPVLFPIVGKLKKGQTIINGRTFEMPQHGFARDLEFEAITKLNNYHSYLLKSDKYTLSKFPFEFELYNSYRYEENKLFFSYKVRNTGKTNMPFLIGGHPAFKIDPDDLEKGNYYLEFESEEPNVKFLYLLDGLVGTDYGKNKLRNNKILDLDKDSFANDAIIIKGIKNKKISLKNRRTDKTILTMDFDNWPYLGIWSKRSAPFLCLEPWMGTADRVNSNGIFVKKSDMIVLEPQEEFENEFSVVFY